MARKELALVATLALLAATPFVGSVAGVATPGLNTASKQLSKRRPTVPAEGTLLGAPKAGMDPEIAKLVEPSLMSIVFSDEKTAWNYYHEAVGNGEHVCISDLGPQPARHHGQRYWLRSC